MEGVETSILVRYLLQDDPALSAVATRLLDGEDTFAVGLVALAETAFVLSRRYGIYTFDRRFPRDGVPVWVLGPDATPPSVR